MFWYSLVLGFLVFFLYKKVYSFLFKSAKPLNSQRPPELVGKWPIFGHYFCFSSNKMHHFFRDLYTKHNWELVRFSILSEDFIVINTIDLANEAFLKFGREFNGRTESFKLFGSTAEIVFTEGERWEAQRKAAIRSLHSLIKADSCHLVIDRNCSDFVQFLRKKVKENGNDMKLHDPVHRSGVRLMYELIFGEEKVGDGYYSKDINELMELIEGSDSSIPTFRSKLWLFILQVLYDNTTSFFDKLSQLSIGKLEADSKCFYKFFEADCGKTEEKTNLLAFPQQFRSKEARALKASQDLFLVATDATSKILLWSCLYLSLHQEVQSKLRAEIQEILGKHGVYTMEDRARLPYLEAFFTEVLRCVVGTPVGIPHRVLEDTVLGNKWFIPKNTSALVNFYGIFRDEKHFENPDLFDPDRFIDETSGNFVKSEVIKAFSMGPRKCPGEQITYILMFKMLVSLLQNFKFSLSNAEDAKKIDKDFEDRLLLALVPKDVGFKLELLE